MAVHGHLDTQERQLVAARELGLHLRDRQLGTWLVVAVEAAEEGASLWLREVEPMPRVDSLDDAIKLCTGERHEPRGLDRLHLEGLVRHGVGRHDHRDGSDRSFTAEDRRTGNGNQGILLSIQGLCWERRVAVGQPRLALRCFADIWTGQGRTREHHHHGADREDMSHERYLCSDKSTKSEPVFGQNVKNVYSKSGV